MIKKGIIAGLIFGILDILPMLFMDFSNKGAAITAAFLSRFAIGLLIFTSDLGVNKIINGLIIGTLLSIPDALITKAYGSNPGIRNCGRTDYRLLCTSART